MNKMDPQEKYVEFTDLPWLMARLLVFEVKGKYMVEIDLVQKESFKIYKHISTLYDLPDEREAFELGYIELKKKVQYKT